METSSETGPKWNDRVRHYFETGWAFLIPDLAADLLYAWVKWPVNAVHGTLLVVLTAFDHLQGLDIAGLGTRP